MGSIVNVFSDVEKGFDVVVGDLFLYFLLVFLVVGRVEIGCVDDEILYFELFGEDILDVLEIFVFFGWDIVFGNYIVYGDMVVGVYCGESSFKVVIVDIFEVDVNFFGDKMGESIFGCFFFVVEVSIEVEFFGDEFEFFIGVDGVNDMKIFMFGDLVDDLIDSISGRVDE